MRSLILLTLDFGLGAIFAIIKPESVLDTIILFKGRSSLPSSLRPLDKCFMNLLAVLDKHICLIGI